MTERRRTWRGVMADLERADQAISRCAVAGIILSVGALAAALYEGLVNRSWVPARPLTLAFAVGLALSILTLRGVRVAAVTLPLFFTAVGGAYTWHVAPALEAVLVAYVLHFPLLAAYGGLHALRIPRLIAELQATWTPREIAAGDVYTVRDGAAYGVVKVLAVEPERVHVRQFGLRYAERPRRVKTSTLERAGKGPAQSYAHLPLDRSEFANWEPHLLRTEPLLTDELDALSVWRRLHSHDATRQPSSG